MILPMKCHKEIDARRDRSEIVLAIIVGPDAFIFVIVGIFAMVGWARIISNAGYSGWWVLVALVPLLNVIMFFVFAFSSWPSLQPRPEASDDQWQPSTEA